MVAYELYYCDKSGKERLIGILPERRTNLKRMTKNSILNWGRRVVGNNSGDTNIYFVKVDV